MKAVMRVGLAAAVALSVGSAAFAQESKSAPLAKQLASALGGAKLDAVAAKDPAQPGVYVAALHIPGVQLLVISAEYPAPALLDPRLAKAEYRDVYIELNASGKPASKVFIEDLGGNGIYAKPNASNPMDMYEAGGKRVLFNGEWGDQKLSEQDYMKMFAAADTRYAEILTTLLGQIKPPVTP
jgi:hypothetical protein